MAVNLVTAPVRKPRHGGLRSVVPEFILEERLAAGGVIGWEESGCGLPQETQAGCYDETVDPASKEFDGVESLGAIGPAFARYAGVSCFIGGDADGPSYLEQAKTLLEQGEDRAVEKVLWEWAIDGPSQEVVGIVAAIAAAEKHADANYVGQPILIMSRADVVWAHAGGAVEYVNGLPFTINGTPIIATGVTDGADWGKVAAIGAVGVYASSMVAFEAPGLTQNLKYALAERVYAIGVDCGYRFVAIPDPTP